MLNANVPPAPTVAVIFAPVPAPPAGPIFTVIVFVVTAVIVVWIPTTGSVDLGYNWLVLKLSLEHLNVSDSLATWTSSLTVNPWFGTVNTRTPECDVYLAFVGVLALPATMELATALTNVCAYCSPTGDAPTLTVTVFAVVAMISNVAPNAWSVVRGYVWLDELPSLVQVNVNEFAAIVRTLSVVNVWEPMVSLKVPVVWL